MIAVVSTHHELMAPATGQSVRRLRAQAAELASELGAGPDTVESVRLAVNEALANVANHAYGGREGVIEMELDLAGDELRIVVRDHGRGMGHSSSSEGAGYGLLIIERSAARSTIQSTPGRGTEVIMVFRVRRAT